MKRVDVWEIVAAVAIHAGEQRCHPDYTAMPRLSAYTIATKLDKLARIARTLHRLYEVACNEPVDACRKCGGYIEENGICHGPRKAFARQCFHYRLERLEKRAEGIGKELSIVVECQRDPRGLSVKLWADKVDGRMLGGFK